MGPSESAGGDSKRRRDGTGYHSRREQKAPKVIWEPYAIIVRESFKVNGEGILGVRDKGHRAALLF